MQASSNQRSLRFRPPSVLSFACTQALAKAPLSSPPCPKAVATSAWGGVRLTPTFHAIPIDEHTCAHINGQLLLSRSESKIISARVQEQAGHLCKQIGNGVRRWLVLAVTNKAKEEAPCCAVHTARLPKKEGCHMSSPPSAAHTHPYNTPPTHTHTAHTPRSKL